MSEAERRRRHRFRRFMSEYYAARQADLLALEHATGMYAAEVSEYLSQHPPMVFKRWLIESRGMPR